jgi:superfamily II DNA or RNA helicase
MKAISPTPCVFLFAESFRVDVGRFGMPSFDEVCAPALTLSFDYDGKRVSASESDDMLDSPGIAGVRRDQKAEAAARYVLEGLGALDVTCAEHIELPYGSRAEYVARIEDADHGKCSFIAYALPQLRRLGWQVDVADDYPWQVIDGALPWYASLEPNEDPAWFNFELGIEFEGQRLDLLPALLELLEDANSLEATLHGQRLVAVSALDQRFLALPSERFAPLLQVLVELYEGRTLHQGIKGAQVPVSEVDVLARVECAVEDSLTGDCEGRCGTATEHPDSTDDSCTRKLRWRGSAKDQLVAARAVLQQPEPTAEPRGLCATLRPYQRDGLAWLQHLKRCGVGGVLADDMGLGKTLQTIAHLLVEHGASDKPTCPSLVIAPTSLVTNWLRELARFAPDLWVVGYHGPKRAEMRRLIPHLDVIITTYPLVLRDLAFFQQQTFHYVVLDEAQTIKNDRSQIHKAVKAQSCHFRLCLSGTPLENHLGELWSLFDFLMPGFLGDRGTFEERYRRPIENNGDEDRLTILRQRVAPLVLRRTKDLVAPELPEKTEIVRTVELVDDQRELYESIRIAAHAQVRHAIAERGLASSRVAILDALMKLRQVCCDPRLVKMNAARDVSTSVKYELFFQLVKAQLEQGRRVLVFSQFTSMLALLGAGLRERGIGYASLTGSTVDRQVPIEHFTGGFVDILLISLKAGGTGLNLTHADTVIHYDPWWNPAAQAQATDRAYRIGQTRRVFSYNLIIAGSVEERMLMLQKRKRDLAQGLFAEGHVAAFSKEELDSLFAPLE